jgi:formylglycine-generating enzyme required for sulfatase activity
MKYPHLKILFLIFLTLCTQGCTPGTVQKISIETPPNPTPTASPSLGDMRARSSDGMRMVYVPGGEFKMGSNYEETAYGRKLCREYYEEGWPAACTAANFGDESPAHMVTLSGYWIDQTEVTNEQYQQCEQASACTAPIDTNSSYNLPANYGDTEFADYPVTWVTRDQARDYCNWAGGRLPTEAEWEYAARGPESWLFPWGISFDGTRLNYCDANCDSGPNDPTVDDGYADTAPVGSFPSGASWVGALDMAGNVREWVADWYGPYSADPQVNPTGPASGEATIPHGGSWLDLPFLIRSANRGGDPPDYARHNVGFRCVKDE